MSKTITPSEFIHFGALAQEIFNMDPQTLEVELHPFPDSKRIILTRIQEEVYSTFDTQIAYREDLVELTVFANFDDNRIIMGYSRLFNTLVVCDYPERKDDDSTKEKTIPRKDKGDLRVGLDPAYVDPGSTGKLYCDRCGCWLGRAEQD